MDSFPAVTDSSAINVSGAHIVVAVGHRHKFILTYLMIDALEILNKNYFRHAGSDADMVTQGGGIVASKKAGQKGKHAVHLWQFLRELLHQPDIYHNCIQWLDQTKGRYCHCV